MTESASVAEPFISFLTTVYGTEDYYLHVYIGRLRRKVEPDPAHRHYVLTEPGAGYRLRLDPAE